jgi:hypothetical protein
MEKIKPAGYSTASISESSSIRTLKSLLDFKKVIAYVSENDKTPNHDGYLELIDFDGVPLGEIKVQVKTLRKKYKKPSYPLKFSILKYVKDVCQIPFLLIAVDNKLEKVFWKHISKELADSYLNNRSRLKKGQKTISINFDLDNELKVDEPYDRWLRLIDQGSISEGRPKIIRIDVDKSKPFLDQSYLYFKTLYSEIGFIPTNLLAASRPIISSVNGAYYNSFKLKSDNSKFFALLEQTKIGSNGKLKCSSTKLTLGSKGQHEKLKFIIKHLTGNLVEEVSYDGSSVEISELVEYEVCECLRCQLERLEFKSLSSNLSATDGSLEELIIRAFTNYKLGNFLWSSEQFIKASELSLIKGKLITHFIIQYNLSKLGRLLRRRMYLGDVSIRNVIPKIESIDLDHLFCGIGNSPLFPVIDWIYKEKFLASAERKIGQYVKKIKLQYDSSLHGGRSSNSDYYLLVNEFGKIDYFLRNNFIIFDQFSEYIALANLFTEGLYASHATTAVDNSSLKGLNNWMLLSFIRYCEPKYLISIFNRYKLTKLTYKPNNEDNHIAVNILRLFTGTKDSFRLSKIHFEEKNDEFIESYARNIRSAIVIASQCDFNKKNIQKIATQLCQYVENYAVYNDLKFVQYFIELNHDKLQKAHFKKFIFAGITNSSFHYQYYIESISNSVVKSGQVIEFDDNEYKRLKSLVTSKCVQCNKEHSLTFLVYIHRMIQNIEQRKEIESLINIELSKQTNFELFGLSVIYDTIPLKESLLIKYVNEAKPVIITKGKVRTFNTGSPEERYYNLSFLLNICFKEDVNLNDDVFDPLRGISPYYNWLLDMENFDYFLFDPKWITEYATIYYLKRMFHSKKLEENLKKYLKSIESFHQTEILQTYLNIYVRKTWRS